ncbi:S-phase kinase-associated protein 1-like [Sycon ciliatum]|uniref:S-phase kinase-associated protein 1-like n=1 Tax=Sycon ciliatum TaxID=27933 RepID=UPI0031F70946
MRFKSRQGVSIFRQFLKMASKIELHVSEEEVAAKIKLKSNDDEVFDVEVSAAQMSEVLRSMIDCCGGDDDDDEPVPLPVVDGATLRKVMAWCTQHKNDPAVEEDDPLDAQEKTTDNIDSWDMEFLKVDHRTLFALLSAANYLSIQGLMASAGKTVANLIKGKTRDEIRKTFNITSDFTAEEEQEISESLKWCEEK